MERAKLLLMMMIVLLVQVGASAQVASDTIVKRNPSFDFKYKHRVSVGVSASAYLKNFGWYFPLFAAQLFGRISVYGSYEVKLKGRFAPRFVLAFDRWRDIGSRQEFSYGFTLGFTPKIYLSDSPRLRIFVQPEAEFNHKLRHLLINRFNWIASVGATGGMDFIPKNRPRLAVTLMFPKLLYYNGHFDRDLNLSKTATSWGIVLGLPTIHLGYNF